MGGCCSTTNNENNSGKRSDITAEISPMKGPLTLDDINARITASKNIETLTIGAYTIEYAFVSQRGYYPDALSKPNQDCFVCIPELPSHENKAFFGVFDGHGTYGDVCSRFSADKLPQLLSENLSEEGLSIEQALRKAHLKTNEELHRAPVDDSMSGTTAISVLFDGNHIHISNVGDSRAIIVQEDPVSGKMLSRPLSVDQTPFRKDERERVKKTGARVMTVGQLEGVEPIHENWGIQLEEEIDESGDPPRIWHAHGDYPGTAFTRSIGDEVSEFLGVNAEPEIIMKKLNRNDRYIIIASDGVFEFITSQGVADMVTACSDPLQACRTVVQEAYNRWLQFEIRTDDITMICFQLRGLTSPRGNRGSIVSGASTLDLKAMQRPVRGISKNIIARESFLGVEGIRCSIGGNTPTGSSIFFTEYQVSEHVVKKSLAEQDEIRNIVKKCFLFSKLNDQKLNDLVSVMKVQEFSVGEFVIRQNEEGNTFYVLDSGELEVRVADAANSAELCTSLDPDDYGQVIHSYSVYSGIHPTFGDLALMSLKPRAATVIGAKAGKLWTLDRAAFRAILMQRPLPDIVRILRNIEILRPLTLAQLQRLAESMSEVTFQEGASIMEEGSKGDEFYVILEGAVVVKKKNSATDSLDIVSELEAKDFFGERSLLSDEPRAATVIAMEETVCLSIRRNTFEQALGRLSAIIDYDYQRHKKRQHLREAKLQSKEDEFYRFDPESDDTLSQETITADQITQGVAVVENPLDYLRLVSINNVTDEGETKLLRTVSKEAIFDTKLQRQVIGEVELHLSFRTLSRVIPPIIQLHHTESDVHLLYNTSIVGTLESFTASEAQSVEFSRFYTASALIGLKTLHRDGVVFRGLETSNLMIDQAGHLAFINFRLSKYVGTGKTFTVCGTSDYLSPEIISSQGHDMMSDFWALGILLYELLVGSTPFRKSSEDTDLDLFKRISSFEVDELQLPPEMDSDAASLIKALLNPSSTERLGFTETVKLHETDVDDDKVMHHPFFNTITWSQLPLLPAPLSTAAQGRYKEGIASLTSLSTLDIGNEYTDDPSWFEGF